MVHRKRHRHLETQKETERDRDEHRDRETDRQDLQTVDTHPGYVIHEGNAVVVTHGGVRRREAATGSRFFRRLHQDGGLKLRAPLRGLQVHPGHQAPRKIKQMSNVFPNLSDISWH